MLFGNSNLTAARRQDELSRAADGYPFDVLVIGGGITGAGTALDAASRGLRTALIEAEDLAFGTSRWSSKLAHGGLRYLAAGDLTIAYECVVERGHLLCRIAPHLVRGTPMMLPLLPDVSWKRAGLMGAGLLAGDLMRRVARTPGSELPRPRLLSLRAARRLAPALSDSGLRGGLLFYDGQLTDDARLVVAVARTAAGYGASILTRTRATGIGADGVSVVDQRTGEAGVIEARVVVNATGVWATELAPEIKLRPSRGTHVVLDRAALPGLKVNLTLPNPGARNRYLLVLPQLDGHLFLGLTDEAVETIEDVPTPTQREIDEMVGAFGLLLGRPVDPQHVLGAYAGLRPLLDAGDGGATSDISRRHRVIRGEHRTVHIVGGKLTTYRRMAEDAVDAALQHGRLPAGPCRTATIPLVGAASRAQLSALPETALRVARYGTESAVVSALERADPTLAEPIAPGVPVTHAELRFSVLHEGPLTPDDLLDRRFRVGLVAADRAAALPAAVAAIEF